MIHARHSNPQGTPPPHSHSCTRSLPLQAIQARSPRTHTIIEAHPQVYEKMIADGWDKKPGVRILFGRWQDVIDTVGGTLPRADACAEGATQLPCVLISGRA